MIRAALLVCLASTTVGSGCKASSDGHTSGVSPKFSGLKKSEITFKSGALTLHGVVYVPEGAGPFPAVLWNHGSWGDPMVAFDDMAPAFVARGWVFFGPFRRGQGLSRAVGPYILDEIERAGGTEAKSKKTVSLLTREHLDDQLAAYAWLTQQPYVIRERIAVGGNSFGGIETLLGAERVPYCAGVDAAGGAQAWAKAPELRAVMLRAARASKAPLLFLQAENDHDLAPSRTLASAMREAGKVAELRLYPAHGVTTAEGHNFAWQGSKTWVPMCSRF